MKLAGRAKLDPNGIRTRASAASAPSFVDWKFVIINEFEYMPSFACVKRSCELLRRNAVRVSDLSETLSHDRCGCLPGVAVVQSSGKCAAILAMVAGGEGAGFIPRGSADKGA
jgi:hypothetical protein